MGFGADQSDSDNDGELLLDKEQEEHDEPRAKKIKSRPKEKSMHLQQFDERKRTDRKEIERKTDELIGDLALSIKNRKSNAKTEKDAEDLFGSTIAIELQKMLDHLKCMAKNEINQVIFKYQMATFNANDPHLTTPSNPMVSPSHVSHAAFLTDANQHVRNNSQVTFNGNMSLFRSRSYFNPMEATTPSTPSNPAQAMDVYGNQTSPAF